MLKERKECHNFKDGIEILKNRLNINLKYGNNDLKSWVIENLNVGSNDKVLDIGCGDGRHLNAVSRLTNNLCMGIDYDTEMIAKSLEQDGASEDKLEFYTWNMDEVNTNNSVLGDNKFDLIYSLYAFYYSKDSLALLDKLKDRLTENGRIVIVGPHGENNKDWFTFINQFIELDDSIMKSSYKFQDDVENYARQNYENVEVKDFINKITLPSSEELKLYWESNIYYDSTCDEDFKKYSIEYFNSNSEFSYEKKAKMIIMGK